MLAIRLLSTTLFAIGSTVFAFPAYESLAGLSRETLDEVIPTLKFQAPKPPPGPLTDTSAKLVNDAAHPWRPLGPGDVRGPCPGLNTLASHGWLPRSGVATPAQIVAAVQDAFNMHNGLALFVAYGAHLVDGNLITDKLSIGGKTRLTGPDPPAPATVAGLNTHALFEGDASLTRADASFGDNHSFNQTLFNQFVDFSKRFGAGKYNLTVAAELRWQRIQDSIATNPNFIFVSPRYFTAYTEAVFPINFFIDGRQTDGQLDLEVARGFFQDNRFPRGFFRPNGTRGVEGFDQLAIAHPIEPGSNQGINNYIPDPTSAKIGETCLLYQNFVNRIIAPLYPNPTSALRRALNTNLDYLFQGVQDLTLNTCTQVLPYGKN